MTVAKLPCLYTVQYVEPATLDRQFRQCQKSHHPEKPDDHTLGEPFSGLDSLGKIGEDAQRVVTLDILITHRTLAVMEVERAKRYALMTAEARNLPHLEQVLAQRPTTPLGQGDIDPRQYLMQLERFMEQEASLDDADAIRVLQERYRKKIIPPPLPVATTAADIAKAKPVGVTLKEYMQKFADERAAEEEANRRAKAQEMAKLALEVEQMSRRQQELQLSSYGASRPTVPINKPPEPKLSPEDQARKDAEQKRRKRRELLKKMGR